MAMTFGASSSDYVRFQPLNSALASTSIFLSTGWYYSTAVNTNNRVWGTSSGARMSVTASSLNVAVNRATTDDSSTFTSYFVTDTWQFVAILIALHGSTNSATIAAWLGGVTEPPVGTTDLDGGGTGAVTGSTLFYTGNLDSANPFSFDGDIADVTYIYTEASGNNGFFGMTPTEASAATGVTEIEKRFIVPLWRGDYDKVIGFGRDRRNEDDGLIAHMPFVDAGCRILGRLGSTPTQNSLATVSGPTFAGRGSPRPWRQGDRYQQNNPRARGRR